MPSSVHASETEVDSSPDASALRLGGYRLGRSRGRLWGISWPPAGSFASAYGEDLMTADIRTVTDLLLERIGHLVDVYSSSVFASVERLVKVVLPIGCS